MPLLGRVVEHRVLARDLVRGHRHAHRLAHRAQHVETRHARLDDQRVCALFHVGDGLAHGLAHVRGVHLVAAAIALSGRGAGGLPERTVERGGILDGVGHDRGGRVAGLIEPFADRGDPAVHHVRGSDHVGPGLRVGDRGAREERERGVVVHVGTAQDTAVAVVGVLAQADVGPHHQVRHPALDGADRTRHRAVARPRSRALGVLLLRDAEKEHRAHAQRGERLGLLCRGLGGEPGVAGERGNRDPIALGVVHEQRRHELVGSDARLARQRAQAGRAPEAPSAMGGKRHGWASWAGRSDGPSRSSATASKSERSGTTAGTPSATSCMAVVVPIAATRASRRSRSTPSA